MFNIILLNVRNKLNEYLLEEVNDLIKISNKISRFQ